MKTIIFTIFCVIGMFFWIPSIVTIDRKSANEAYAGNDPIIIKNVVQAIKYKSSETKQLYKPFLVVSNPRINPVQIEIKCDDINTLIKYDIPGKTNKNIEIINEKPETIKPNIQGLTDNCTILSWKDM